MNQEHKFAFPGRAILITALISAVSLVALLALFSRVVMLFDRFERYYEAICYAVWGLEALFLGFMSRKKGKNALIFIISVILLVFLFVLCVGLLLGGGRVSLARIGLHFALYAGISLIVSILPQDKRSKNKQKRPANHFRR